MAPTDENFQTFETQEMAEGSGARVKRAFPSRTRDHLDPFVLLDEFYVEGGGGFPEHPHEGFEILTYMLEGAFEHADTTGAEETVHAGGAQRITAGSGLKHSELPGSEGRNRGLQLWINLPREDKETDPDYADAEADELPVQEVGKATVKTVVGDGSPLDLHTPAEYLVVSLPAKATFQWDVDADWNGFCYVADGRVSVAGDTLDAGEFGVTEDGEALTVTLTAEEDATVALVSGRPHHEPITQRGPVVL
ncbi:MAG: pirin family protein [Halopenitus sp.]